MTLAFYIAAGVALTATIRAISHSHAVHALLYLVVSLLSLALIFLLLGAPFVAGLEVIVYAGAIMVLFLFVVMMLGLGRDDTLGATLRIPLRAWLGPGVLTLILVLELVLAFDSDTKNELAAQIPPQTVATRLLGQYLLGVELASMLLLAGVIAAYHLARGPWHVPPHHSEPTATGEEAQS